MPGLPTLVHILAIAFVCIIGAVTPILLDDTTCLAPSPCTCLNEFVDCSSKHLNHLPSFNSNSQRPLQFHVLYVYLFSNSLSVIPNNGFNGLRTSGATTVNIYLYNNQIHTINDNAFSGIEDLVNDLALEDNRLTILPTALGKLRQLRKLSVQGNFLRSVDASVLQNLGSSLTDFHFSAEYMTQIPSSLSFLRRLTKLQVDKIPFSSIGNDSFMGLENTLTNLIISDSNLHSVPDAFCRLQSLQSFTFKSNTHLTQTLSDSNSRLCPQPMTSVKTVRFSDNGLIYFPDVFNVFPNASSITVSGNPNLFFFPSELVNSTHNVTDLNLDRNKFNSIPHAIAKLQNLRKLSLRDNQIRVIDGDVFDHLNKLVTLDLNDNPVVYIENSAFSGQTSLQTLNLESTSFKFIPRAVLTLPALGSLNLNSLAINCTCDITHHMSWPRANNITIMGQCSDNAISIQNYVRHYLRLCK